MTPADLEILLQRGEGTTLEFVAPEVVDQVTDQVAGEVTGEVTPEVTGEVTRKSPRKFDCLGRCQAK